MQVFEEQYLQNYISDPRRIIPNMPDVKQNALLSTPQPYQSPLPRRRGGAGAGPPFGKQKSQFISFEISEDCKYIMLTHTTQHNTQHTHTHLFSSLLFLSISIVKDSQGLLGRLPAPPRAFFPQRAGFPMMPDFSAFRGRGGMGGRKPPNIPVVVGISAPRRPFPPIPIIVPGERDPRQLRHYVDLDAPSEETTALDYRYRDFDVGVVVYHHH